MAASARRVAVAVSGGLDSTALLHASVRSAKQLGVQVLALHVNHGLQAAAGQWQDHVHAQCRRWARAGWPVQFLSMRLEGQPEPGQSVEAWARDHRYRALAHMARAGGATLILLAHHRRDQAETLLLQALRGAGPAGLASMPARAARDGLQWVRPWLDRPHDELVAYARRWRLSYVDDPSNADVRFDRNRLRHAVWPHLLQAFPHAESSLCQVARQAAGAAALIDEIAALDLSQVVADGSFQIASWLLLSPPRRRFALRAWLAAQACHAGGHDALLSRLTAELPHRASARWPVGQGDELRLYRGTLRFHAAGATVAGQALSSRESASAPAQRLDLRQPGDYRLPAWGGLMRVVSVAVGGVASHQLVDVRLCARRGGELFQRARGTPPRSLKKQFQAAAVPAWERSGPVVWAGERLVFVPGLGLDARVMAPHGVAQLSLQWIPEPTR